MDATNLGGLWSGQQDQGALWNALTNNGQWAAAQPQGQPDDAKVQPQPSDQGALWNTLTNYGQWRDPQQASSDAATPDAPQSAGEPHGLLGHIAAGIHHALGGLLGFSQPANGAQPASAAPQPTQGQPQPQQASQAQGMDALIQRIQPNWGQVTQEALLSGVSRAQARDSLIERNLKMAMLPSTIRQQLLMNAAINQELAGGQGSAAQGGGLQNAGAAPQGASPNGAPSLQTAGATTSAQSAPQAGAQGGSMFSPRLLQLMALEGNPNAKAAYDIGTPEWDVDRGTHVMYDKKTGRLGQRISAKEYVNNFLTDPNDPNAPTYIPKLPEGTMPDGNGGVIPIPGYSSASAQAAGAVAGAQEAAKAPYDTVVVQTPQGPVTMSKAQLAAMQGSGSPTPQGAPAPSAAPSASPSASPSPQGGSRRITPQQALQFYVNKGLRPDRAAGVVGNLIGESGLDASSTADDGSFGLANWTGPRLQGLFAFAKANKLDPSDPNAQLEYSWYEMNHGEKAAGDAIRSAGNVDDATAAAVGYERPAGYTPKNPRGASNFSGRLGAARQLVAGPGGVTAQPAPPQKPFIAQGTNPSTQSTDQDELKTLRAKVEENRYIASKANEFIQKQGNLATGPGYGIGIGPVNVKSISEMIPGGHGTQLQDLDAVTNQAWVHLRPQGSGALRGPEIESFKEAFPNTENLGQANVNIADRLNAELTQSEHELAFKESYLQKYGTLNGADAAWAKQPEARNAMAGQGSPSVQPKPAKRSPVPAQAPSLPGRAPPADAIKQLKSDPSQQAQAEFDQVFGVGAAKRALQGA